MGRARTKIAVAVLIGWLVAACGTTPSASPPGSARRPRRLRSPRRPRKSRRPPHPPVGRRGRGRCAQRRPRLPHRAPEGDPPEPVPRRGRGGVPRARREHPRGRRFDDRCRVPRGGHGPDGASRPRRPFRGVGDGPAGSLLHAWPIWLWDFPDGLRVVAAREPYTDLVGARLTMVGGASVEDAIATVESLVPRDNPSTNGATCRST